MPVLDVLLAASPLAVPVGYRAIVDTGADYSIISTGLGRYLGLPLRGPAPISGIDRKPHIVNVYGVHLSTPVGNFVIDMREYGPEVIIGRDVLNRVDLRFDGPNLRLVY